MSGSILSGPSNSLDPGFHAAVPLSWSGGNRPTPIVGLIPALNEGEWIGPLITEAAPFVDKLVVCDDGSTDMTGSVAERLGVEVLRHPKRLGYGAALRTLFRRAIELDASIAITLDADRQHDPRFIPSLARPILDGRAEVVTGSRFMSYGSNIPLSRLVGVTLVTKLAELLLRRRLTDAQCGMRAYSNLALNHVIPEENGMGASLEILFKAQRSKLRLLEVPTQVHYNGESDSGEHPLLHLAELLSALLRVSVGGSSKNRI